MPPQSAPIAVTLYARPDCHLCIEAEQLLRSLGRRYRLSVSVCNVESSLDLLRRYGWLIPVVRFEDGQELHAPIVESELRAALEARARR